jgi:hypothetical protein
MQQLRCTKKEWRCGGNGISGGNPLSIPSDDEGAGETVEAEVSRLRLYDVSVLKDYPAIGFSVVRMRVLSRMMRAEDVSGCVGLLASHPAERHRYGSLLDRLAAAWKILLRSESLISSVLEDTDAPAYHTQAFGVSAFVTDEFLQQCKTPHALWIGRELVRRVMDGDSPVLAPKQVRNANSREGLNLVTWTGIVCPLHEEDRPRWVTELTNAFMLEHRGFKLKEAVTQPVDVTTVRVVLNSGALLWRSSDRSYGEAGDLNLEKLIRCPFILGMNRELVVRQMGTWASTLFLYTAPRICFRPAEQRLLRSALKGATDEELSDELRVSLSFIKKTWHSIYERAADTVPDLHRNRTDGNVNQRGKEKKQRVLSYVRNYPEELRPILHSTLRKPQVSLRSA